MKYERLIFGIFTCADVLFWLAYAYVNVHKPMVIRTEPEQYGWSVFIVMVGVVIPLTLLAYQWGKASR